MWHKVHLVWRTWRDACEWRDARGTHDVMHAVQIMWQGYQRCLINNSGCTISTTVSFIQIKQYWPDLYIESFEKKSMLLKCQKHLNNNLGTYIIHITHTLNHDGKYIWRYWRILHKNSYSSKYFFKFGYIVWHHNDITVL